MMIAQRLTETLQAAGIPILGVSIGRPEDRSTWLIRYAPSATPQDRAAGAHAILTFDPTAPAILAREDAERAAAFAASPEARAWLLFYLRDKLGRNPTAAERADARAALVQASRDVAR